MYDCCAWLKVQSAIVLEFAFVLISFKIKSSSRTETNIFLFFAVFLPHMIPSVKYQLLAQLDEHSGRMLFVNWMANSCNYKFGILPLHVFILALFYFISFDFVFHLSFVLFCNFFSLSLSLKRIITNTINICMARDSLYVCLLSVTFLCGYLVFVYRLSLSVCVKARKIWCDVYFHSLKNATIQQNYDEKRKINCDRQKHHLVALNGRF